MFKNKSKSIPTPPHKTMNCHSELVSESENLINPNGDNPHPNPLPRRGDMFAFTLAEVLITLVIIGVIAAITVPTLINKTQNQEYVSKLKKAYSTLSQATNLIIAEEGSPKNGWAESDDVVFNLYKKHLNIAKDCNSEAGCFNQLGNNGYTFLNKTTQGSNDWNTQTTSRRLILSDGTQILFDIADNTCPHTWQGSSNFCARIYVDINGERKPNIVGRDVFTFVLKPNGLVPLGCDEDGYCNGPKDTRGVACACKVLREGAMNY